MAIDIDRARDFQDLEHRLAESAAAAGLPYADAAFGMGWARRVTAAAAWLMNFGRCARDRLVEASCAKRLARARG